MGSDISSLAASKYLNVPSSYDIERISRLTSADVNLAGTFLERVNARQKVLDCFGGESLGQGLARS